MMSAWAFHETPSGRITRVRVHKCRGCDKMIRVSRAYCPECWAAVPEEVKARMVDKAMRRSEIPMSFDDGKDIPTEPVKRLPRKPVWEWP